MTDMRLKAKFLPEWIIRNYCHAYMFMQFSIYMDNANKGFDSQCVPRKKITVHICEDFVKNFWGAEIELKPETQII